MAESAMTYFASFFEALAEQKHNLASDQLKIMLTNVAPNAADEVAGDITEIAAGNGYSAGGEDVTVTSSAVNSGVYELKADPTTFLATGNMAQFRYAVLYNSDAASDELIGYWDYGAAVDLTDTETFVVTPGDDDVLISLAAAA